MKRRIVGVVRVSQRKGREEDRFHSPRTQREKIEAEAERKGERVVEILEEIDVSGKRPLTRRPGLLRAIEMIENDEADDLVVAYHDRLMRSIKVQAEVTERVERKGGDIYALDHGRLTNGSAAERLSANMLGAVAQFLADQTGEKIAEACRAAVAAGKVPWSSPTPGYVRGPEGRLVPDPATAPVVRRAFELRDEGATIAEIRSHLAEHGIERAYSGVSAMLHSRVVLGEIHYGEWSNLTAHQPIVDVDLFNRVQRRRQPPGRKAKSERLLARLGVLRCGTCGGRMSVDTEAKGNGRTVYRCTPSGQCSRKVSVNANRVETIVVEALQARESPEGQASIESHWARAKTEADRAQANLDAAFRVFAGYDGERAAAERIAELTAERDVKCAELDRLGPDPRGKRVSLDDWTDLSLSARRDIVRATIDTITVAAAPRASVGVFDPARVSVEFFAE